MKKRKIILIILVILIGLITIYSKLDLYINWKIYLPGIQRRTVLFDDFFQDGDQISVIKYYNKLKMNAIKKINHFNSISPENMNDIEEKLLDFYDGLGTNINENNSKGVYDEKINNKQLLNTDNYYLIKQKNKSYIILILDMKDKKLYIFITVRN